MNWFDYAAIFIQENTLALWIILLLASGSLTFYLLVKFP